MIVTTAGRLTGVVLLAAAAAVAAPGPAVAAAPACSAAGLGVTALHGPNFYLDTTSNPVLRGAYAGYRVTDTSGAARTDLWVQLGGFTGGSVTLGAGQPAAQQVAALGAGGSAARFFYLTAQQASGTAQQHTVSVWRGRPDLPGSAELCATTGGFASVQETIKAAANKLTSVTVSTGAPRVGGTFTVTVQGDTGTIGAGTANDPQSFWMSPAASGTWPAGAYRLVGTSLTFAGGATYTDTLRVSGLSSPAKAYTAVYTFRAVGYTGAATGVLPVQQIASGTQIKHTDVGSVASLPAIAPPANDLTVALTATPAKLPDTGGTAAYRAAVTGSAGAVLDSFTATLPAGATVVPGSVRWNGGPAPDAVPTGGAAVFTGPFTVTGTADALTFDLALPAVSGDRRTGVTASVGAARIDTTAALTDDAPATGTVNVNTFPAGADDAVTVAGNRTSTVAVLANDADADADALSVTAVGAAGSGTATLSGGVLGYTPAPGFTGTDTFTYTVDDGRGGTDTATVTVTVVTPAGPPAQAADDTATAVAGTTVAVDVLGNDSGQQLSVTAAGGAGNGTVSVAADGSGVAYTAGAAFAGTDTFTYTVTDLAGATSTGTVTVTVTAAPPPVVPPVVPPVAPAPPVANGDTVGTTAGAAATVSPLANDTGDGPLTLRSVGPAAHGTPVVTGGDVVYQPAADFWGTDAFTYTVADVHGATATATVAVTVGPRPGPHDDTAAVAFGTPTVVDVLANDPAGAAVAAVVTGPAHGTATTGGGGALRYTPAAGYTGPDSLTYRLVGSPVTATVTLRVAAPDLRVADDALTVQPGTATRVDVLANDTGTGLSVDRAGRAGHGTTELRPDGLWYTPAAGHHGADAFTYTVRDAAGQTATGTVAVTVTNTGPGIAAVAPRSIVAGGGVTVPFTVTDPDGDPLTLSVGTPAGPAGAAGRVRATVSGTAVTVTADRAFSGVATVAVTVSDGTAAATASLQVTVRPAAAGGATARVLTDPRARAGLTAPVFAAGRPVSRTLATRVDSLVGWRVSPTASVVGYHAYVDGARVCTVPAVRGAATQVCRVNGVALTPGDTVRVVAVGADGVPSAPAAAAVAPPAASNRLLAVVYFPSGEFVLDATARRVLAGVAAQARTYGFGTARMVGHTDGDGSAPFNLALSRQRAAQVAAYFRRAYPGLRADHTGYGETRRVLPDTSERAKAANRRVEIYVG